VLVHLREITDDDRDAVVASGVAGDQERFVASVQGALPLHPDPSAGAHD
jgi:hypothetical protein